MSIPPRNNQCQFPEPVRDREVVTYVPFSDNDSEISERGSVYPIQDLHSIPPLFLGHQPLLDLADPRGYRFDLPAQVVDRL